MQDTQENAPQPAGIVEQLVRDDVGRKRFLKMVGSGGAASFGAFVLAACGSSSSSSSTGAGASGASGSAAGGGGSASAAATTTTATAGTTATAQFGKGDLGILNYALTLEYLETQFYSEVVARHLFTGHVGSLVKEFGDQEASHVSALTAAIKGAGGTPASKPNGKFPIHNAAQVAQLAYTVENLGAAAYLGQAANIQSKAVLAAALAIHSVEARHAATLGTLVKKSVTPDGAFAKPADVPTVLAAVKPFLG